jgi:xanthine dehydrogenase accessory factor
VDIYLEPVLPPPRLVVFGAAPVARALSRLGKAMGYAVDVVDPEAERTAFPEADRVLAELPCDPVEVQGGGQGQGKGQGGDSPSARDAASAAPAVEAGGRGASSPDRRRGNSAEGRGAIRTVYAVVATMGRNDEEAILSALALEPAYLGVIASRKRFGEMSAMLAQRGASAEALRGARNPAGLDIGAKAPEEIALSVLAEIVKVRRAAEAARDAPSATAAAATGDVAIDPICGMTVVVATAKHRAEHAGRTWYFCNARCREKFLATPERWAAEAQAEARQ